jgi:hypothetical protein
MHREPQAKRQVSLNQQHPTGKVLKGASSIKTIKNKRKPSAKPSMGGKDMNTIARPTKQQQ